MTTRRDDEAGYQETVKALSGNDAIRIDGVEVLSDDHYVLRKVSFQQRHRDGHTAHHTRETYDRGNGAVILLYDPEAGTVLLTRQFRMATYLNGHPTGSFLEAPAGLLDDDDPESAIRREAHEETGVTVGEVEFLYDVFMSPGSVTERLAFFAAPYRSGERDEGGGVEDEGEDIEVVELTLVQALEQVASGEIQDAKTIMLLQWAQLQGRLGA